MATCLRSIRAVILLSAFLSTRVLAIKDLYHDPGSTAETPDEVLAEMHPSGGEQPAYTITPARRDDEMERMLERISRLETDMATFRSEMVASVEELIQQKIESATKGIMENLNILDPAVIQKPGKGRIRRFRRRAENEITTPKSETSSGESREREDEDGEPGPRQDANSRSAESSNDNLVERLEKRVKALEVTSRRTSVRSCHGFRETGVTKSDLYIIDPDGVDVGLPPMEVFCDFSDPDGVDTVIYHNVTNQTISVDRCPTPGCFRQDITYDAAMGQIKALMDISESCSQQIKYDCFHAPLSAYANLHNSWWVGRTGAEKYYWSGPHTEDHTCACGLADNCTAYPGLKCNCDSAAPEWFSDDGVVRDKSALPVASLFFGGLKYPTQKARFSLGPLRCRGVNANAEKLDSCLALKKSGQRVPGYYLLDSPGGADPASRVAKCNFDLDPTHDNFEEATGRTLARASVIFNVRRTTDMSTTRGSDVWTTVTYADYLVPIVPLVIQSKRQDGMDITTGTFTAPVNGVYFFSFVVYDSRNPDYNYNTNTHLSLRFALNERVQREVAHSGDRDMNTVTLTSTMVLLANDTVEVQMKGYLTANPMQAAYFMGHLLEATSNPT